MSCFRVLVVSAVVVAGWPAGVTGEGEKPLVLKAIGSFYVGGERALIQHSGGAGPTRPGHIWDGGNKQIADRIMRWIDLTLPPLRTRRTQKN